tara:strand:- start:359 stop:1870 length:1512 start_codon:yes stop_codon:yes gene_type:complete
MQFKQIQIKKYKKQSGDKVTFIASTDDVDRYSDIIDQKGWLLDNYKKNPVILFNHNSQALPIGRGYPRVENDKLMIDVEFDMDDELGAKIARKVKNGFMSAVSVGFNPKKAIERSDLPTEHRYYGERGMFFEQAELLEVSVVTIPANAAAIAAKSLDLELLIAKLLTITKDKTDYGLKSNAKEAMEVLSEGTQTALKNKAKDHNEKHGDDPAKKITNSNYLAVSYHRGLAAFHNNPASVRPGITSDNQWAMARVNGLLYALRNGRYRSGKFDVDLLPAEHPIKKREKKMKEEDKEEKAVIQLDEDQILMIKEMIEQLRGSVRAHGAQADMLEEMIDMKQPDQESYYEEDSEEESEEKEERYLVKKTDFPKKGDDEKISMRNSNHKSFPLSYAKRIKSDYPDIWRSGGNIKGNAQFAILSKIQDENNGVPKTKSQEDAIKLREAWAARHKQDFRLAGVVAQMKWLVIGDRGLSHMKDVINEEIEKQNEKSFNMALLAELLNNGE